MPKQPKLPVPPIDHKPWPDGINPYLDPEDRQKMLDTRRARADELNAWQPGAGDEYLRNIGAHHPNIGE